MTRHWAVQDAKARFSELLREAENAPQIITYRGQPKFELRAMGEATEKDAKLPEGLPRWWTSAPKLRGGLKLPSRKGTMRKVEF